MLGYTMLVQYIQVHNAIEIIGPYARGTRLDA